MFRHGRCERAGKAKALDERPPLLASRPESSDAHPPLPAPRPESPDVYPKFLDIRPTLPDIHPTLPDCYPELLDFHPMLLELNFTAFFPHPPSRLDAKRRGLGKPTLLLHRRANALLKANSEEPTAFSYL